MKVIIRILLVIVPVLLGVAMIIWPNTNSNILCETVSEVITEHTTVPTEITIPIESTCETTEEVVLIDEPATYPKVNYDQAVTYWEALGCKDELFWYISLINTEIDSGKYTDSAVQAMKDEALSLEEDANKLQLIIDKYTRWLDEYPDAAEVWFYLRSCGYSEEVSAGIIGNMMIETSGGTLDLNPIIYDSDMTHYGLCQWSLYYYPQARDLDLPSQLGLLESTIQGEFHTFGFCYRSGFTFDEFIALESPEDAALAFAKVYERCASGSYNLRMTAARTAYEYFTCEE